MPKLPWPEPSWLLQIPDSTDRIRRRTRFHFAVALLHLDGFDAICERTGVKPDALRKQHERARPTKPVAIAVEELTGLHRSVLRPDLFA